MRPRRLKNDGKFVRINQGSTDKKSWSAQTGRDMDQHPIGKHGPNRTWTSDILKVRTVTDVNRLKILNADHEGFAQKSKIRTVAKFKPKLVGVQS